MTKFTIASRLDLATWRGFLGHVHTELCEDVPASVGEFLTRIEIAPEGSWEANSQEWSLRDARWFRKAAAAYCKALPLPSCSEVAIVSAGKLNAIEPSLQDLATPLHRRIQPWLGARAPELTRIQLFISCGKALHLLLLGLSELLATALRMPIMYSASEIRTLCEAATQAARSYRSHPGATEFFPFTEAAQRLCAQSIEVLQRAEKEVIALAEAARQLPVDSSSEMKRRHVLNLELQTLVQRARSS